MFKVDTLIYDNVEDFYYNYVEIIHNLAKDLKLAKNGVVNIPMLRSMGLDSICGMLDDPDIREFSKRDIQQYNYMIPSLTTAMGIVFSQLWNDEINKFTEGKSTMPKDIIGEALSILRNKHNCNDEQLNFIFNVLPEIWMKMLIPYMEREDYPKYTVASLIANFQLAMSIVLEDYR